MTDLIDRQEAIDAVMRLQPYSTERELINRIESSIADAEGYLGGVAMALDELKDLDSIDAEQVIHCYECKHGEPWYEDDGFRRCTKIQQYGKVYPGNHFCGYAKRWGEE